MATRFRKAHAWVTLSFGVMWISGCGGGGTSEDSLAGPCVIVPSGPSLTIAAATHATTGLAIPVITLSDVKIGGTAMTAFLPGELMNAKPIGSNLECTVACGFSSSEGATTFTVSAPGYASKTVNTTSTYATRVGGCPGSLSNGARISIALEPLP